MPTTPTPWATLDDLHREPGKAELIGGKIVRYSAAGCKPSRVAGRISRSLAEFAEGSGRGEAFTANMGFGIGILPSGRQSFCPDASYFVGPFPANPMRFIDGPPTLAIEVRIESDRGRAAEAERIAKRDDYFAAGTGVVWDVGPVAEGIFVYRAAAPDVPTTYVRGQTAEAEPAAPDWRVAVDGIFPGADLVIRGRLG